MNRPKITYNIQQNIKMATKIFLILRKVASSENIKFCKNAFVFALQ